MYANVYTLCLKKGTPTLSIVTLRRIFCTNIPDTAGHQMALQVPTSPNICLYTTWGKQNNEILHFIQGSIINLLK